MRPVVDAFRGGWQNVRMSHPTAVVRMRVPARRLRRAEKILSKLGLTPADVLFLSADEQAAVWTEALGAY